MRKSERSIQPRDKAKKEKQKNVVKVMKTVLATAQDADNNMINDTVKKRLYKKALIKPGESAKKEMVAMIDGLRCEVDQMDLDLVR